MISKKDFKKITDFLWEIPKSFRSDMKVPGRIYVSEEMLEDCLRDKSIEQLINTATLPGIVNYALAMPDAHQGYGFPIGGVAAIEASRGVISPAGIGFDQNCGVRLLKSEYTEKDIRPYLEKLAVEIQREVPSGLGKGRKINLSIEQIDRILEEGVPGLVSRGYGKEQDIENCEAKGRLEQADADFVSHRAKSRGRNQVGTLGSGNHFLEIQKVKEIFDEKTAEVFGLFKNQVVVMIHTGSRGLGHQNCSDYLKIMEKAMQKYEISVPDRELACVPFNSQEGKRFFKAMSCGANYAWANRHMITFYTRKAWKNVLGEMESLDLLYDVAHNIAKIEECEVGGKIVKLCMHRKGATRAFSPGNPEIPVRYRNVGQPVLIPGSMGTASYVLVGTKEGRDSFYSTSHGAGRTMSRREATRRFSGQDVVKKLEQKNIIIKCQSLRGIAEEAPLAYKNIDNVIEVVHNAGLSKKVAKLVPLAVIKGE
jgi:tRNA-splicing ligase RtcB